jgi:hypothetical protein
VHAHAVEASGDVFRQPWTAFAGVHTYHYLGIRVGPGYPAPECHADGERREFVEGKLVGYAAYPVRSE